MPPSQSCEISAEPLAATGRSKHAVTNIRAKNLTGKEISCDMGNRTGKTQAAICYREANTIFIALSTRTVFHIMIGNRDITALEQPLAIAKGATQHQCRF